MHLFGEEIAERYIKQFETEGKHFGPCPLLD
jgi:hypothetical protein